jgi:glucosamine--fructose-6-phosphate aminotransferase (isomerizing)
MCGIVGYIGKRSAEEVILDGLRRLEYRGYDSAGIALYEDGGLFIEKTAGRLSALEERVAANSHKKASLGIGHTRWATHGAPNDTNSHPHTGCSTRFAVVHNGIIENYAELRRELSRKGHHLTTETDTEVIPHLLEDLYQGDLPRAVLDAVSMLKGAYAIAVVAQDCPSEIVAYRQDSPLIIGLGYGENLLASDIPALLPYTRRTVIMENGELAVIRESGVEFFHEDRAVQKDIFEVTWDAVAAEKAGFDHFMQKEIHEQPKALRDTLLPRIVSGGTKLAAEIGLTTEMIEDINRIHIVACGTAYHAGLVGKHLLERLGRIAVEVDFASEYRYRQPILSQKDLVIIISQSGETADTVAALREARKQGAKVLAITNVVGSAVSREGDHVLHTWAGPEIAVASTKAYTTQLASLALIAIEIGLGRGTLALEQAEALLNELKRMPALAHEVIVQAERIKALAEAVAEHEHVFFIGRGLDFNVALEGALKLKEISYIHAEAYAAGELKHGTLALITEGVPVISLFTQPDLQEKMLSNVEVVNARGGHTIVISSCHAEVTEQVAHEEFRLPCVHPLLAPIISVIPLQLIAYYAAVARGADVDKPRNLAKSVTVE